jgi:hypothetical protein
MYLLFGARISYLMNERSDENALPMVTFAAGYTLSLLGNLRRQ